MKRTFSLILVLISVILVSCTSPSAIEFSEAPDEFVWVCGGKVIIVDDWVFYYLSDVFSGLYAMKMDGTEKRKIASADYIVNIDIHEDWIYFTEISIKNNIEQSALYRVNLNGENKEKILDNCTNVVIAKDGSIFYQICYDDIGYAKADKELPVATKDMHKLYCYDINSGESTLVVDDWLYYYDIQSNNLIYDNDEGVFLKDLASARTMAVLESNTIDWWDWSYPYVFYVNNGILYSKDVRTSEEKAILDKPPVAYLQFSGIWFYYLNENASIYKKNIQTLEIQEVCKLPDDFNVDDIIEIGFFEEYDKVYFSTIYKIVEMDIKTNIIRSTKNPNEDPWSFIIPNTEFYYSHDEGKLIKLEFDL